MIDIMFSTAMSTIQFHRKVGSKNDLIRDVGTNACFFSKILPLREIGFCTYLYRNSFHHSGVPACQVCFGCGDRRPMALPYPYGRRLEADHIHFSGRSPHQPTDVGLTTRNDLLKVGCNLDKFWSPSARSIQRLCPIRLHMIAIQPRFP